MPASDHCGRSRIAADDWDKTATERLLSILRPRAHDPSATLTALIHRCEAVTQAAVSPKAFGGMVQAWK
jgi:hypothetical protein